MANYWIFVFYIFISFISFLTAVTTACHAFFERKYSSNWLAVSCVVAAFLQSFYLCSVMMESYFAVSMFTALYMVSGDLAVFTLLMFIKGYSKKTRTKTDRIVNNVIAICLLVDMVIQFINPFNEIVLHFNYVDGYFANYAIEQLPLHWIHIIFTFVVFVMTVHRLLISVLTVPSAYKRTYIYSVTTLLMAFVLNMLFIFLPIVFGSNILDFSIGSYAFATLLIYISCFRYPKTGMRGQYHEWIVENVNQSVVLFNYAGDLIIQNKKVKELFPEANIYSGMSLEAFSEELDLNIKPEKCLDNYSFQHYVKRDGKDVPIRFDHRCLFGTHNEMIGQLFVFTDETGDVDLLTSFYTWDKFKQIISENPDEFKEDIVVAVCDINGLGDINTRYGKNSGDHAIETLADTVRKHFVGESYYIRGQEASLVVLCYDRSVDEVKEILETIRTELVNDDSFEYTLNIQSAVGIVGKDGDDVLDVIKQAFMSMKNKKLLDAKSRRSELVTSLVKTLSECDNDTEEHVRRTQVLGAELGKRLGFSDMQLSDLALLCILHDIGKIGVPLEILNKPGKLNDAEWRVLRKHTEKGYQIATSSQELSHIADMIKHHHESWDGRGYPDGLTKESIPLLSRVIAVVDAYDAMVNDRCYRPAMPVEDAIKELKRCAGTQFDPSIVNEFIRMLPDIGDIKPEDKDDILSIAMTAQEEEEEEVVDNNILPRNTVHLVNYSRYVLDSQMRIVEVDEQFERITGYTLEELKANNTTQLDLLPDDDRSQYIKLVTEQLGQRNLAYFEHRIKRKDGTIFYVFCFGKVYYDSAVKEERSEVIIFDSASTYAVKLMISEEQNKSDLRLAKWENKYRCDSLTGLLNHEALKNDVEKRILEGKNKIMFLMMDVDKFKEYNDTFGHKAGDEFLITLANALSTVLRKDDLACRMGGDEFSAALFYSDGTDDLTMLERAQQICDKLNMVLASKEGGTSLSMGVALSDKKHDTFNKLYLASDKALYKAKAAGRSQMVVFRNDM